MIDPNIAQALQRAQQRIQPQQGQQPQQPLRQALGGQQQPGGFGGMMQRVRQAAPQQQTPQQGGLMQRLGQSIPQGQPGGAPMMQRMQQRPAGAGMASAMGGMGGAMALSDERSKKRIEELEGHLHDTYAALGGRPATAGYVPPDDHREEMDDAYSRASSNSYEYRDPSAPGAAPGRQAGPMAHELRPIPGVVHRGPDGMDRVDTGRLTMANTSQLGKQRRELDDLRSRLAALGGDPDRTLDLAAGRR